jgi:hypothetical protein
MEATAKSRTRADKRDRLKKEAGDAAMFRGHWMDDWRNIDDATAFCSCARCGKTVSVNSNPMPNEIDIHGEAVALHCPGIDGVRKKVCDLQRGDFFKIPSSTSLNGEAAIVVAQNGDRVRCVLLEGDEIAAEREFALGGPEWRCEVEILREFTVR